MQSNILPYSQRDIADALPEFMSVKSGFGKAENPVVIDMLEGWHTLTSIARHYITGTQGEDSASVISRALGSTDFGNDVATSFARIGEAQFSKAFSAYAQVVLDIGVPNFKPPRIANLSVDDFRAMPEFAGWPHAGVKVSAPLEAASAIATSGAGFIISRQAMINDDISAIAAAARQIGNQAALNVAATIASTLESAATLDDGLAFFNATTGNLTTVGGTPSVTTFDAGLANLYRRTNASGLVSGVAPRFIVAPPELTTTSMTLMNALYSPGAPPLSVVVLPHLTDTFAWYLLPDPSVTPVLGLLHLEHASPLTIERVPVPMAQDGIAVKARLEFRIVRMSRYAYKNDGA